MSVDSEIDEIDSPMPGAESQTATVQPSGLPPEAKAREGSIPPPGSESSRKAGAKIYCPLGSPDGTPRSHSDHDERIRELEEFKKTVERTPRILAERVIRLERAIKTLYRWLPPERQRQIEQQLEVRP